ncbi:hypothetical protein HMPREF9430_00723 [Solobacterium moorei F0204]|uniref:Uncharacterized protein n=1 Tax=Solobacterium moorei F0204 TaxID=706433 RepID=E7MMF6_9FIRM|nr:hypothetical protein HMPREF9430_00723 [Solobacterium moorei F0204]
MGVAFFIREYTRKKNVYFHNFVEVFSIMKVPRRRLQEGRNSIFLHFVHISLEG